MPPGDLITRPYQLEYNGIVLGDDNWDITGIDGLDLIAVREADEVRPLDHGDFDLSPDLMPNRVVIVRCNILTTDPTKLIALRNATGIREANQTQLLPLVVRLYDGVQYLIYCRVRRRATPIDFDFSIGAAGNFTLMFWAPDPRIYSNNLYTAPMSTSFTGGTGFTFDIAFDISFGGGSTGMGQAICLNEGDISTSPVVTITGPLSAPRLINDTTGDEWSSTITLGAGEVLTVDFGNRTVTLAGATRYSTVTPTSVWWKLQPGVNVVRLVTPSGTGTGSIQWRSAWHALV